MGNKLLSEVGIQVNQEEPVEVYPKEKRNGEATLADMHLESNR